MGPWASPSLAAQAAYLRYLGTAAVAESVECEGVYAVHSGIASNSENGVISRGDVPVGGELALATIAWLHERKRPASWLCAEGEYQQQIAGVLEAAGCLPENNAWEMRSGIAHLDLDFASAPREIRVLGVESERELEGWLDVAGACLWFESVAERHAWRNVYRDLALGSHEDMCLYIAVEAERPVGMASAFYTDEHVLLTAVGVVEERRRRGIGRALALTRLRDARNRGCALAVLAPSPDGSKLYDALGFETHPQPADRWFYLPTLH